VDVLAAELGRDVLPRLSVVLATHDIDGVAERDLGSRDEGVALLVERDGRFSGPVVQA
jgi:hypothetical protein